MQSFGAYARQEAMTFLQSLNVESEYFLMLFADKPRVEIDLTVRKVGLDGTIRTIAGVGWGTLHEVGFGGDGGPATSAWLSATSVVVDSAGNLYFGDQANRRIRKITVAGVISTIAGIGPPATP
jgi:hypothetical protein